MKQLISSAIRHPLVWIVEITVCLTLLTSFLSSDKRSDFPIPRIISNKQNVQLCLSPKNMLNAWYDIEFIEPFCEVLDLTKKEKDNTIYKNTLEDPTQNKQYEYSNDEIIVVVDTVNEISMTKRPIWASYLFHHKLGNKTIILQDDTLIQDVKSFPVYIANISENKNAMIETQDGSVMMIIEAQDEFKQWRPIEYWSHSWCGNSYAFHALPPRHFAFTRGIKCSGDFLTTCRLKLLNEKNSLYSNEFRMSINKTQFNKPLIE